MAASKNPAVLHVGLNPVTGPWSVMRELAKAQAKSGLFAGVGIGLITYGDWSKQYETELQGLGLPGFRATTPKMFGTASFLWQRIQKPPLAEWVRQLAVTTGARSVIVHFHNAWLSGVFIPIASPLDVEIRVVVTFHGVNADFVGQPIRLRLHRWMAQRLIRHAATLTSVDSQNPRVAEELFGIPQQKFTVIPNGAPSVSIAVQKQTAAGSLVVGHVGTLNQVKGWRIIADAVQVARATGRDIRLIVAGTGPDESSVRQWAKEHPAWFEYVGFVHDPQRNILPRLGAFVLMAEREGLPMAIVEAMSVGLPVITTPVGGIPDAVIHGKTGLLISRAASSLAAAICSLSDDREKLNEMGTQALKRFQTEFLIDRVVYKYNQLYCSLSIS